MHPIPWAEHGMLHHPLGSAGSRRMVWAHWLMVWRWGLEMSLNSVWLTQLALAGLAWHCCGEADMAGVCASLDTVGFKGRPHFWAPSEVWWGITGGRLAAACTDMALAAEKSGQPEFLLPWVVSGMWDSWETWLGERQQDGTGTQEGNRREHLRKTISGQGMFTDTSHIQGETKTPQFCSSW